MNIISVVNQKGGCGKTITAVNLSASLSRRGHKVLLIDLDPQAHATFSLKKESGLTITDILEKICQNQALPSEELFTPVADNLFFIPSRIGLASIEQKIALTCREDRLTVLSTFLKKIEQAFDYILLDCPPNLGLITLNALESSQYSLIPLTTCDFSLKGIETLKDIFIMLKEFKGRSPTPFYLLTQVDRRSKFSKEFIERVRDRLGNLLLPVVIRTNIYLREAASKTKTIFEYKPASRGAEDFTALGDEIEKLTSDINWVSLLLKSSEFSEVYAVGDFNNWQKQDNYRLKKIGEDIWGINIALSKGSYRYKFLAGGIWISDPHNTLVEKDPFGGRNSLIVIE